MKVTVHFFTFKDLTGTTQSVVELPEGATLGGLTTRLREQFPHLFPLAEQAVYLLNQRGATHATMLHDGDQVLMLQVLVGG